MMSRLYMIQLINIYMIVFFINSIKKREVQKVLKSLTRLTRLHDTIINIVNQYINTYVFVNALKQPTYTYLHDFYRYTKTNLLICSLSVVVLSCNRVGHFCMCKIKAVKIAPNLQIFKSNNHQINYI